MEKTKEQLEKENKELRTFKKWTQLINLIGTLILFLIIAYALSKKLGVF